MRGRGEAVDRRAGRDDVGKSVAAVAAAETEGIGVGDFCAVGARAAAGFVIESTSGR